MGSYSDIRLSKIDEIEVGLYPCLGVFEEEEKEKEEK
jgi:hypothetical protein